MTELEYQIVRSPKRKKLTITVERDRAVVVHAPEDMSDDEVRRVVDAKRSGYWRSCATPRSIRTACTRPARKS